MCHAAMPKEKPLATPGSPGASNKAPSNITFGIQRDYRRYLSHNGYPQDLSTDSTTHIAPQILWALQINMLPSGKLT